jgi:hypothetical protein
MFEHRLAALLGRSIGELLELPEREVVRWWKYWNEEPWGPYRDNWHAARICAAALAPHVKDAKVDLTDFMFEHPEDTKDRKRRAFIAQLESAASSSRSKRPKRR